MKNRPLEGGDVGVRVKAGRLSRGPGGNSKQRQSVLRCWPHRRENWPNCMYLEGGSRSSYSWTDCGVEETREMVRDQ